MKSTLFPNYSPDLDFEQYILPIHDEQKQSPGGVR